MRRILAILLLVAFGLPIAAPAFAMTDSAEAHLPACCRRDGAHHCAMFLGQAPGAPAVRSTCPNYPHPAVTVVTGTLAMASFATRHAVLYASATGLVQRAETQRRIARDRSHHKRGPPNVPLS
jgi:hypothetical protein